MMFKNTNDTNLLIGGVEHYKNTFGSLPLELATDRGFILNPMLIMLNR